MGYPLDEQSGRLGSRCHIRPGIGLADRRYWQGLIWGLMLMLSSLPAVDGWRGPHRTGVYEGAGFPLTWSDTENVLWSAPMPNASCAEPIVVGDRVITVSDRDWLLAHDLHSGKELWRRRVGRYQILGEAKGLSTEEIAGDDYLWEIRWIKGNLWTTGNSGYGRNQIASKAGLPIAWGEVTTDMHRIALTAEEKHPSFRYSRRLSVEEFAKIPCEDDAKGAGDRGKEIDRMIKEIQEHLRKRYDIFADMPTWYNWGCDINSATPVSCGRFIYTAMGEGQVACHDLDGKRIWAHAFTHKIGRQGCEFFHSPLLAKGVLFVYQGSRAMAFDATTGKVLWEAPKKGTGFTTGSPVHLDLGSIDIVVDIRGVLSELRTGKEVGALGFNLAGGNSGGASPVTDGKSFIIFPSNSGIRRFDLKADDKGAVTITTRWEKEKIGGTGGTGCLYQGLWIVPSRSFRAIDIETGEIRSELGGRPFLSDPQSASPSIADGIIFCPVKLMKDDKMHTVPVPFGVGVARIEADGTITRLGLNTLTPPHHAKPYRDQFLTYASAAEPVWRYHGNGGHGGPIKGGVNIVGNRILIRSHGMLYCIGKPGEPFRR